jgi:hypothetical protein
VQRIELRKPKPAYRSHQSFIRRPALRLWGIRMRSEWLAPDD